MCLDGGEWANPVRRGPAVYGCNGCGIGAWGGWGIRRADTGAAVLRTDNRMANIEGIGGVLSKPVGPGSDRGDRAEQLKKMDT